MIIQDPAILVAEDFIALSVTLAKMQLISQTCGEWANENGLNWNPANYQLLKMIRDIKEAQWSEGGKEEAAADKKSIILDCKTVQSSDEADYFGLVINNSRGFIHKYLKELQSKKVCSLHDINTEVVFVKPESNVYFKHI